MKDVICENNRKWIISQIFKDILCLSAQCFGSTVHVPVVLIIVLRSFWPAQHKEHRWKAIHSGMMLLVNTIWWLYLFIHYCPNCDDHFFSWLTLYLFFLSLADFVTRKISSRSCFSRKLLINPVRCPPQHKWGTVEHLAAKDFSLRSCWRRIQPKMSLKGSRYPTQCLSGGEKQNFK